MSEKKRDRRPWLEVIHDLRTISEKERWRLAPLGSAEGWQTFASMWAVVGPELRTPETLGSLMPAGTAGFEDQLAWAWDVADPLVDHVLRVIDSRCPLPPLVIRELYDFMEGTALIFPDGTVASTVLQRVEREQAAEDAAGSLAVNRGILEMHRVGRALAAEQKKAQGQNGATP